MSIAVSNSVPRHVQAANFIREQIYRHEWAGDSQIPSEFELAEMLGMSRGTVRRAIASLVEEGLLVQMRGKGTFVSTTSISHPSGSCLLSFAESLKSQGVEFKTKVVKHEVISADAFLSGKLACAVGAPVLLLNRVRSTGGEPIIYFESALSLTACPGLEDYDFNEVNLFETIERAYRVHIGYSKAQYAARVAGEERGEFLGISPTAPVLHLQQQIFLENSVPIEWSNVWLRSNRYVVGTVLQRM